MDHLITYEDETGLQHHGILGQKWGVRRYQNYDGTYTQAGMKRYNASKEKYDKYNAEYKEAKKNGTATHQMEIRRNNAKHQMDKDYKHLKQDKLGDQGKMMYSKGYRIREASSKLKSTKKAAYYVLGGSLTAQYYINLAAKATDGYVSEGLYNTNAALTVLSAASVATLGGAYAKQLNDAHKNKKMRAYYSHTSNY